MKEYRVLYSDDAVNEDKINELARQGFKIVFAVSGYRYGSRAIYMERDSDNDPERVVMIDEKNNIMHVIGKPL
jgi:hypothetical protein